MSTIIKLGKITIDALDLGSRGNAILGIRDSGKTYTGTLMAERLFEAGVPFTAFDPIGVWRFLRVPGKGRGYPVVVAGGADGDLALTPKSAPAIVEAAMQNGVSLVIDLFSMDLSKADWRRIVRDSVRLMLHRNQAHGLRHVFIEEAAEFAPQRVVDGEVYAEIEKLARMGGNSRLGYTLINQRAEEVNKAVLELCDNLFLHRQKGRNSLTALSKWLDIGNVKDSKGIIETLSTLPTGECWAWLQGTDEPIRFHVPKKNSLHPDRRVMRGEASVKPKGAVDVRSFVETMRTSLIEVEKQAKENDPAALKKRIAELTSENQRLINIPKPSVADADAERRAYEKGAAEGLRAGALAGWAAAIAYAKQKVAEFPDKPNAVFNAQLVEEHVLRAVIPPFQPSGRTPPSPPEKVEAAPRRRASSVAPVTPSSAAPGVEGTFSGREQKVIIALAFWRSIGHDTPSREQVAAIAGYSPTSGTFRNIIGGLRTAGAIDYPPEGGAIFMTGAAGGSLTVEAARDMLLANLEPRQRKIIDSLCETAVPRSRGELGGRTGYEPTSGTFRNILGSLRTLKIIDYPRDGEVGLTDWARELLG